MISTITLHYKINKKAIRFFYTALMKQHITQTQNTINMWKRDLHTDEIDIKWETKCSQICYIIPVKLRSFYFKFIHRALTCNYTLHKMKIAQRDYCRCFYNVPETLMHMFWECSYVQKLWKQFGTLFLYSQQNMLTLKCIILYTYNKENQIYTLISTIVKTYIFAFKYTDKIPDPVECWY